ncbi:hypothetical protein C8R46DRAFT_1322330 [Mycena filopes]|nr:hypothetical protein C8R46DRAFT_1322330 [Mycena filopes]
MALEIPNLRALAALHRLPPDIRAPPSKPLALQAATSGDHGATTRVLNIIEDPASSPELLAMLFPVFYINLDPTRIPRTAARDKLVLSNDDQIPVYQAICAMTVLSAYPPLQPDACSKFWERMWEWLPWLVETRHLTAPAANPEATPANPEATHYSCLVSFITPLQRSAGASAVIAASAGIGVFVAGAWKSLLADYDPAWGPTLITLAEIVGQYNLETPIPVEEFVVGAGGSASDLTDLVLNHLHLLLKTDLSAPGVLKDMFTFTTFLMSPTGSPFLGLLLQRGIIPLIIGALIDLSARGAEDYVLHILKNCWAFFAHLFDLPAANGPLQLALKSQPRLLHAILSSSRYQNEDPTYVTRVVEKVLQQTIPRALFYPRVIAAVQKALTKVSSSELQTSLAAGSGLLQHWIALLPLVAQRRRVWKYRRSTDCITHNACDNLECGRILIKRSFRCCEQCEQRYYCSYACQRRDWQQGGHREECTPREPLDGPHERPLPGSRHMYTAAASIPSWRRGDREFLRTLLDHEYHTQKFNVLARQAIFLKGNPDTPFLTLFMFQAGGCRIDVFPSTNPALEEPAAGLAALRARAICSGGRLQLHVAWWKDGARFLWHIFPLRSESGASGAALVRIARDIPDGVGNALPHNIVARLQVLNANLGLQIHTTNFASAL